MMSGAFIVFEGIDGSGKSTLCRRIAEVLESEGISVEITAEPTHQGIGAIIRSGAAGPVSQETEALLFVADRNDHTEKMGESVSEGKVVLCDRYFASTVAYQSSGLDGKAVDTEWLLSINSRFIDRPDMVVLLDIEPEKGLGRVDSRGEEVSKFENLEFLRRVRSSYLALADRFGFKVVDASRSPEQVFGEVMAMIREVV